jgi:hypothetical protein
MSGSGRTIIPPGVTLNAALSSSGANRFDNAGTFRKSANTGTTLITANFTNYGTVDIRSGIIAANGGYAPSANARLNCALGGTTPGTNYGQLQGRRPGHVERWAQRGFASRLFARHQ